jgi:hypothetical protein
MELVNSRGVQLQELLAAPMMRARETDLLSGIFPTSGPVLVYVDDYYYMGGTIAEPVALKGLETILLTSGPEVAH